MPHDMMPANSHRLSGLWITIGPPESPCRTRAPPTFTNRVYKPRADGTSLSNTHLARIETSLLPARADEYVRYVFDVTGRAVHRLAHRVVDHGNGDFLQHAGQRSVCETDGTRLLRVREPRRWSRRSRSRGRDARTVSRDIWLFGYLNLILPSYSRPHPVT